MDWYSDGRITAEERTCASCRLSSAVRSQAVSQGVCCDYKVEQGGRVHCRPLPSETARVCRWEEELCSCARPRALGRGCSDLGREGERRSSRSVQAKHRERRGPRETT